LPIPEKQLETWAAQGSIQQSAATYQTIRRSLELNDASYANRSFEIFLQGSYGNDTNVFRDSDVDVVVMLTSIYYSDTSGLSATDKAAYDKDFQGASYTWNDFKSEVLTHLRSKYEGAVTSGRKAIFIKGNNSRREADVLVAAQFKRFFTYRTSLDNSHAGGLCFWLPDGTRIVNYPKIHSAACSTKHAATKKYFKPMVRIFKNLRNRMIEDRAIAEGIAPSYFLEGMLYNVPDESFGGTYQDTFVRCFNWINEADKSKLVCANGLTWLVREDSSTAWPPASLDTYIKATSFYWQNWK